MSEAEQAPQKRTYPIGIVGMRGAGKTVYLAALYHQLAIHRSKSGFFIQTPQEDNLIEMFSILERRHKWLDATVVEQISEWEFGVKVMTPQKNIYEACVFHYYDYAGELLSRNERINKIAANVATKLAHCSALIGVLDGEKICHTLRGTDTSKTIELFSVDIPYVTRHLSKPQGDKLRAIQIIVSKWDYLERYNITLKDVRELLLKDASFNGLFKTITPPVSAGPSARSPVTVRLIPVSSVGSNFVDSNQSETTMKIRGDGRVEPWNVEIPFACLLPDIIMNEIKFHQAMKDETLAKTYDPKYGILYNVVKYARHALVMLVSPEVVPESIQRFLFGLGAEFEKRKEMQEEERAKLFETEKAEAIKKVNDNISAFEYTLSVFARIQTEFNIKFPDNKLF